MFKLPEPIIITLTDDQIGHINTMAQEIYEDPYRRRDRDLKTMHAHCWSGVPLEFALKEQGATMNPKKFDFTDADSHNWDVEWHGLKAEVKNSQDPGKLPDKYEKKWLTISNYMANKIVRNNRLYPNCVDIIIFGCYNKLSENTFDVRWRAVVPFDTIRNNLRKCQEKYDNNWTIDHDGVRRIKYFYSIKTEPRAVYNYDV